MLTQYMVFLSNTVLFTFSLQQCCEIGVSFSSFCSALMIPSLNISHKATQLASFRVAFELSFCLSLQLMFLNAVQNYLSEKKLFKESISQFLGKDQS